MSKSDEGYLCSSCNKCVVDYREKTVEEIKATLKPGDCGIFSSHQLTNQKRYSGYRRFAFGFLVFLATLGFNVKPLKAQTDIQADSTDTEVPDSVYENIWLGEVEPAKRNKNIKRAETSTHHKPKRRWFRRKRYIYDTMGCPSF
jgi:hypothetical protein